MSDAVGGHPSGPPEKAQVELAWPAWMAPLRPFIHLVAALKASVQVKLLFGFLIGALLVVGMAAMSFFVIASMSQRADQINVGQQRVDLARQLKYNVTIQSHHRSMALLTKDPKYNQDVLNDKSKFAAELDEVEKLSPASQKPFFDKVRAENARYAASGDKVVALYVANRFDEAQSVHLSEEHPISHNLEVDMDQLTALTVTEMAAARTDFNSLERLLLTTVGGVALASVLLAVLLGLITSSAFVRPVRVIGTALARIAGGDFSPRVSVPNRDEFGTLSRNLNSTTSELSKLYGELERLNTGLEAKVEEQLGELERASGLRRYLSPQLADSIMSGRMEVGQKPRRRNLTILFADLHDFTPLSQRVEPDELVDMLNEYLTTMTEIVFRYGGTLDKYVGDAIMAFYGDPVPFADHPARAVKTALEMREQLLELQRSWHVLQAPLSVAIGISTGYVTVGNIGSPSRLEYTVIGNHVNLASRLADRAKPGQILISERTLVGVEGYVDASEVFNVRLQGVSKRLKVFEINPRGQANLTVLPPTATIQGTG